MMIDCMQQLKNKLTTQDLNLENKQDTIKTSIGKKTRITITIMKMKNFILLF